MGNALSLIHSVNILLEKQAGIEMVEVHKKRRILAFRRSLKSRKRDVVYMCYSILSPQNI